MFYVENPNREKPREPRDSELPLYERKYKDEDLRSNDLDISLRQKAVTTENACNFSLTLSLSLCHSFFNSYTQCHTTSTLSLCNMVTLAHIYTYMTLGLFTNIVFVGLSQYIYKYSLCGLISTYLHICPSIPFTPDPSGLTQSGFRIPSESGSFDLVLSIHIRILSGGTKIPTVSQSVMVLSSIKDYVTALENLSVNQVPHSVTKLIITISKEYAWPGLRVQLCSLVLCYMHVSETPEQRQMLVRHILTGPYSSWCVSVQGC